MFLLIGEGHRPLRSQHSALRLLQRLVGISPDVTLNSEEEVVDPHPQVLAGSGAQEST